MKRSERIGGKAVPLRRAETVAEVGVLLKPGVIVEMDPATAAACGACADDCIDWEEAFEAAEDPFEFGDEGAAMKPLDSQGRDDYFRRVADVLIAQIEAGTAPWVQSWQAGERVQPYNLKTGK